MARPAPPLACPLFHSRRSGVESRAENSFSVSIPYTAQLTGAITLRVFDLSAKDGSVIDLVDVPLSAG